MYHRLSEKVKHKLCKQYECQHEYRVAYSAVEPVSERYKTLSPEEIWHEAHSVVKDISKATVRQWKVEHLFYQLKSKYNCFHDQTGRIIDCSEEQQSITAMLVLFDVVCMLSLAKRLEPEQAEQHPYYEYIKTILNFFCHSTLFHTMLAVLEHAENELENHTGHELSEVDYMSDVPLAEPQTKSTDWNNDKVRIAHLKNVYVALQQQLGADFKGGSQWFYVYRMLADNKVYPANEYSLFAHDLKKVGVSSAFPDTNTFSRKQQQIKANTTYPNWKVQPGKKQTVLEQGIRIARIAFGIFFS